MSAPLNHAAEARAFFGEAYDDWLAVTEAAHRFAQKEDTMPGANVFEYHKARSCAFDHHMRDLARRNAST